MTCFVEVIRSGPLTTVQDLGRPGYAHLGVPPSGAADPTSLRLANRLVGNPETAAGLEMTLGGAALRFERSAWIALTGAPAAATSDGRAVDMDSPTHVPASTALEIGAPRCGVRTYLAIRGGISVPPVLGSAATDLLSGLGPAVVASGTRLPFGGGDIGDEIEVDLAPTEGIADQAELRIRLGPRDEWFGSDTIETLTRAVYQVTPASNRVGVRLSGPPLHWTRQEELPSEGVVTGALQVPRDGQPILFLPDHPTTGGYPVIAVALAADLPIAGQLRPGGSVRFRLV